MRLPNEIERNSSIAEAIVDGESVQVVVHRARGFARLRGLIGRPSLPDDSALLFARCHAVHGCFMERPLFVVFAEGTGAVTSWHVLEPWRFASDRRATCALEFELETADRLGLRRAEKFIFANKG